MNEGFIIQLMDRLVDNHPQIRAVGIGVPGAVHQGIINVSDIPNLVNVPLADSIRERHGLEVIIENDMNLTVYGLYQEQEYEDEESIIVATFIEGSLPGAGIMIDGHIHRGIPSLPGRSPFAIRSLP